MYTSDQHEMTSLSQPFKKLSLNSTQMNHQFFLLVRDQKYDEAYKLGQKILQSNPNNSAIERFCDFIRNNHQGLKEMLEEQQYESEDQYEDEQDDEQQQDDDEDDEDEVQQKSISRPPSQSNLSKMSSQSIETIKVQKKHPSSAKKFISPPVSQLTKKQINKENAHKWDHNCKNPDCPNKNKPHKH